MQDNRYVTPKGVTTRRLRTTALEDTPTEPESKDISNEMYLAIYPSIAPHLFLVHSLLLDFPFRKTA